MSRRTSYVWIAIRIASIFLSLIAGFEFGHRLTLADTTSASSAVIDCKHTIEDVRATLEVQEQTIASLREQLSQAQKNPASQLLSQSGHVMNEAQCRAWIGVMAPPPATVQTIPVYDRVSTVLYEAGRAQLNVSLLPLPGAPRIAIGPHSELAPRWILSGRVQPQMVGETRQASYYYFDPQSSQWQGPFVPQRIVQ